MICDLLGAGITSVCSHIRIVTSHFAKLHFHGIWQGEEEATVGCTGTVGEQHAASTLLLICRLFPTHLLASLSSADMAEITYSKCDQVRWHAGCGMEGSDRPSASIHIDSFRLT